MNLSFLILLLVAILKCLESKSLSKQHNSNIIYLNEKSGQTIRLKSVLSLADPTNTRTNSTKKQIQKIFWSFKRIYSQPNINTNFIKTQNEISQLELMISLDSEVQDNLSQKYSISDEPVDNFDLIISNLSYSDSGLYKCNLWNQKTIFYHLTVYTPISKPELSVEKSPQSILPHMIIEGSNLTLKCLSKFSYPYPTIKWFQNNLELAPENSFYKLIDKETNSLESTLNILNLNSSIHLNNLTCKLVQQEELNDQQLWQSSEPYLLNIAFRPQVQVEALKINSSSRILNSNILIYENDSDILFACKFKSNPSDKIEIKWKLDNRIEPNQTSDVFAWSKRSVLKPSNLTCLVENSLGQGLSTVNLTVLYEPRIQLEQKVYDLDEFTSFQVNCSVDSSPRASQIEWRKYYINHTQDYELISNSSLLDLKSIKHKENSGVYICVALNQMQDSFNLTKSGQNSQEIELNIRFAPLMSVLSKKQAANVTQNSTSISCLTMSNPRPEINWFKNGLKLNTASGSKYKVQILQKSKNFYESILTLNSLDEFDLNKKYECEAVNLLGSNKIDVELVPVSKPDRPVELRALYVDFMTITLAWSPGFDGGLEQTFSIQLNDSIIELNSSDSKIPGLVNLTNLFYQTMYSIRLQAKNSLGSSDWSEYILVRTSDIQESDRELLPSFDTLFLNVPKNRLEYQFKEIKQNQIPLCLNLSINQTDNIDYFKNCLPFSLNTSQFSLEQGLNSKNIKSLKASICFRLKPTICSSLPTNAIIDTYNKISHSSLLSSKKNPTQNDALKFTKFLQNPSNGTIPIALIIGISVCILALIIFLFASIIYCIRRRNFKACKPGMAGSAHTNKTFNVDIASISAPVASTVSISASQLTNSTSSDLTASNKTTTGLSASNSTRRTFTAALTQTATSIIKNNSIGRGKISEILVTEDEDKQNRFSKMSQADSDSKDTNTTGSTNSAPYIFTDYTLFDQQQAKCLDLYGKGLAFSSGGSTGSNSDPIAINNSLSSNSTSDSPIYGYNIAGATTNFVRSQSTNLVKQQKNKNSAFVAEQQPPESGYSTPSRPKKVVYEVIV